MIYVPERRFDRVVSRLLSLVASSNSALGTLIFHLIALMLLVPVWPATSQFVHNIGPKNRTFNFIVNDKSHPYQYIDSVPLLEMFPGGADDAVTRVYADGLLVDADANGFQALEIPHNTSVCAK